MKLNNIVKITATLKCLSGLHIGAGDGEMHIGGVDKGVIKHPVTQLPYIPGSSIKGKMRSLLEWKSGLVRQGPLSWSDYQKTQNQEVLRILQLFGVSGADNLKEEDMQLLGPTRLSFWDCDLNQGYVDNIKESNLLLTEIKTENSIDRIGGTAMHPRQMERVPSGAEFDFSLSVKIIKGDEDKLMNTVLSGLKLLEYDSIGGSGSRGYGKIRFENLKIDGIDSQARFDAIDPFKSE